MVDVPPLMGGIKEDQWGSATVDVLNLEEGIRKTRGETCNILMYLMDGSAQMILSAATLR